MENCNIEKFIEYKTALLIQSPLNEIQQKNKYNICDFWLIFLISKTKEADLVFKGSNIRLTQQLPGYHEVCLWSSRLLTSTERFSSKWLCTGARIVDPLYA